MVKGQGHWERECLKGFLAHIFATKLSDKINTLSLLRIQVCNVS